ncbi:NACHT domain-containing protein [Serratia proteamaculans]|uniref:NACHT domain-containing protein n=1 Tax=Serratia proteamaculans TaxID=28151 RepID=UPI002179AA45|nr:transcriptional regulator [Serratia proteamaculans]CAI0997502.1 Predicted NTPase (NACHT family) [Serratia proteamaculans]
MRPENYKKIEAIHGEVTEFHPILEQLFKRLPSVCQVEYHQGPHEFGADFVIIKYDETLDEETYIGVVCKVGKITQTNSEVERQIEECKLHPRLISSGKKQVTLNEIWVVNNSTISNNAEQRIFLKFSGTNIKFLSGTKITELIEKHYPEFWTFNSVSYGQYFSDLELTLLSGRDNSLLGSIDESHYIQQKIIKQTQKQKKLLDESLLNALTKEKYIFLEGHVGSGKSTIIKQLINDLKNNIDINNAKGHVIPVFFHYSDVNNCKTDLKEIVLKKVEKYNLPGNNEFVVIIDGVDEVKDSSATRIDNFTRFVKDISSGTDFKLLVTSRVSDSIQEYESIDKIFTRYAMVPLSIGQIINFVDSICASELISQKLKSGIEKTPLFKFIPRTPISAILLARILKDEIKELPSTMAELYSKYTEIVLGRWDTSKGLLSQTEYEIIHNVFMDVSDFMMVNSLSCISESEVEDIFLNYIYKRNIKVDFDKVLERILRRSELAIVNPRNGTFSFAHRSFMEYFYAEKIIKNRSATLDQEIYNVYWNNTYFFYLGLLRDSEPCINSINSIVPTSDYYRFSRLFMNGRFYLAAYLTPYDIIHNGVRNTFIEAGNFYFDIAKNGGGSDLKQFPPVALLCIFTTCLQNNYAYEYFQKALKDTADELDKVINPSEQEQFSRFFLSATLNEIGDKNAFDKLVEKNHLDILVQLGITHVANDSKKVSQKISRYFKKLKGQYAGNKRMENYIIALHEKPIKDIKIDN